MTEPKTTEREKLNGWLLGNQPAVEFVSLILRMSHIWDDLVDEDWADKDPDVSRETLHSLLWQAIIVLPSNPFYQAHFPTLNAGLQRCILDWLVANDLERDKTHPQVSYVLRDSVSLLVVHVAMLVGGLDHARVVARELVETVFTEPLEAYTKEILECRR